MQVVNWIKTNWLAAFVVVAVLASFLVSRHDANVRVDQQRTGSVAGCKRQNERVALEAAFILKASDARKKMGNVKIAEDFAAFGHGLIATMPLLDGKHQTEKSVEATVDKVAGHYRYSLTKSALTLQARACEQAYPHV